MHKNATKASFLLIYRIARAGKLHTIAKDLIKPCMVDVVTCILGEGAAKKVVMVHCSNNTVSDSLDKIDTEKKRFVLEYMY